MQRRQLLLAAASALLGAGALAPSSALAAVSRSCLRCIVVSP